MNLRVLEKFILRGPFGPAHSTSFEHTLTSFDFFHSHRSSNSGKYAAYAGVKGRANKEKRAIGMNRGKRVEFEDDVNLCGGELVNFSQLVSFPQRQCGQDRRRVLRLLIDAYEGNGIIETNGETTREYP